MFDDDVAGPDLGRHDRERARHEQREGENGNTEPFLETGEEGRLRTEGTRESRAENSRHDGLQKQASAGVCPAANPKRDRQ
jgi:hypothetical protein